MTPCLIQPWTFTEPLAVVGDIHGRVDLLDRLLHRVGTRRIAVIGNVIDRGPDTSKVIADEPLNVLT